MLFKFFDQINDELVGEVYKLCEENSKFNLKIWLDVGTYENDEFNQLEKICNKKRKKSKSLKKFVDLTKLLKCNLMTFTGTLSCRTNQMRKIEIKC